MDNVEEMNKFLEKYNLSKLIIEAALNRKESIGAHSRNDDAQIKVYKELEYVK